MMMEEEVGMVDEIQECGCHRSTAPIQRAVNTPRVRREVPAAVTFGQFHRAAQRLGWSQEFLLAVFRSKIDQPKDLLDRIFDRHQRSAAQVIPFRSLLTFYALNTARRGSKRRPTKPAVAASFPAKLALDRERASEGQP